MIKIFQNLVNLFLKSNCALCQRSTPQELCPYCTKQLQSCHLENPEYLWKQTLPIFVWGNYNGSLKRAIAAMKYENQPQIANIFGHWLGETWLLNQPQETLKEKLIVIPIPMHPKKQKKRGFNQAELIAKGFCKITGLKLNSQILQRNKETQPQFSLSFSERQENLADAFTVNPKYQRSCNKSVLLIDDIYTTGATAKAAAKILEENHIKVLGLAVVATPIKQ